MSIDINRPDYYITNSYNFNKRTKERLLQLSELGLEELGIANFGKRNIIEIYIERVWHYSEQDWSSYLTWIEKTLKEKK